MRELIQRHSLVAMISGFVLWSLFFLFCYSFLSIGCALGWANQYILGWNLIHLVLWGAMGLTLLLLVLLTRPAWQLTARSRSLPRGAHGSRGIQSEWGGHDDQPLGPSKSDERERFTAKVALLVNLLAGVGVIYVAAPFMLKIPPCIS